MFLPPLEKSLRTPMDATAIKRMTKLCFVSYQSVEWFVILCSSSKSLRNTKKNNQVLSPFQQLLSSSLSLWQKFENEKFELFSEHFFDPVFLWLCSIILDKGFITWQLQSNIPKLFPGKEKFLGWRGKNILFIKNFIFLK